MQNKEIVELFRNGSKTYFNSSLFFPKRKREQVTVLYAFVRKADNFVDKTPQDTDGFYTFVNNFEKARGLEETSDVIVNEFAKLEKEIGFDRRWTDSFLAAMEQDLTKKEYQTIDETLDYIYGSANVVGLFMSKLMGLDKKAYYHAEHLGKAMQFINFIRDIDEDINSLNRNYFPQVDLQQYSLKSLEYKDIKNNPESFKKFVNKQIKRYLEWQIIAEKGYKYIPKRYLIAIKTASDKYNWTAKQIIKNPLKIYQTKIKPSKTQIILTGFWNAIRPKSLLFRDSKKIYKLTQNIK